MYDTPRAALVELTDDTLFERVAVRVLRARYPEMRITGPSGDLGRDGFGHRLFGEKDEIVLMASCERWTAKLKRELARYGKVPQHARPEKAVFVTNRSTKQTDQNRHKKLSRDVYGIQLEIVDLNELDLELMSDAFHHVAEFDLGVRPRQPRVLQPPAGFLETLGRWLPGINAPLVGRHAERRQLRDALDPATGPGVSRVVLVEGPGGIGKTRLAVEGSRASATTLVARTATALSPGDLIDVPLDVPAIVVVDDAHRSPDLSGLAAMVGDARFDRVRVVLTVRPGFADVTLAQAGLADEPAVRIVLEPLDRPEIDQIVTDHGITNEAFRQYVITLAQGNPLIAHGACDTATVRGQFGWKDAAALLRERVAQRLLPAGAERDEHQAAAVALGLLTSVDNGQQLAPLADAVKMLPLEPHRLDVLLANLADAGIAIGPPYTLQPAVIAPVLVADALDPTSRVRVKVDVARALGALGRAALWQSGQGEQASSVQGLLGIGPLPCGVRSLTAGVNASRLAAQLAVLVQAARDRGDSTTLGMVRRAVRELLADDADLDNWLDVLTIAQQAAPAVSHLVDDLRDTLVRQWPPAPSASIWDDDPVQRYRFAVEQLGRQAALLGERAGYEDPTRVVRWLLDAAWLVEPVLGTRGLDAVLHAIDRLAGPKRGMLAGGWDALFDRRQSLLAHILRWARDRTAGPPAELGDAEAAVRGPEVTARVLLRALASFFSLVVEGHDMGTTDAADVLVLSHHVLPDDPRTVSALAKAVAAASDLLDDRRLFSSEARDVLHAIARLPGELRAVGARGLPRSDGPLPQHAVAALDGAADSLSRTLAARWPSLPVAVRRTAARVAVRPVGNRPATLAALATAGDPVAVAAADDEELTALLVLQPVDEDVAALASGAMDWNVAEARHRQRAEELAGRLPLGAAIRLLEQVEDPSSGLVGVTALPAFAQAAGRNAATPDDALTRLAEGPLIGGNALLAGLLQSHDQQVIAWLRTNITDPHVAGLTLGIADDLPDGEEVALLDAVTGLLTVPAAASPAAAIRTAVVADPVRRTVDQTGRVPSQLTAERHAPPSTAATRDPSGDADSKRGILAHQLVWHLTCCRRPVADRLARLAVLGDAGPAVVLPDVLSTVGHILTSSRNANEGATITTDPAVLRHLVAILGRRLAESDRNPASGNEDDKIARGGIALAVAAPGDIVDLLAQRLSADATPVIPLAWHEPLMQLPAECRGPLALAFQRRIDELRAADALPAATEQEALTALTRLGGGTDEWAALIRRWAAGNAEDRGQAAIAVKQFWHHPIWTEIVPELLAVGLDERSTAELLDGIEPHRFGPDIADRMQPRRAVLQPLLDDPRPPVCEFATKARQRIDTMVDWYTNDSTRRRRGY